MSGIPGAPPATATVQCPYCLEPIAFDPGNLVVSGKSGGPEPLDLRSERIPARQEDALRDAFQPCPNTSTVPQHFVPALYLNSGQPLTVAMVGSSAAGKSHLLAAMLGEVERGGLDGFGLGFRSVNAQLHDRFLRDQVQPLHAGQVLTHTRRAANVVQFVDALLITGAGPPRPVAFFDLAGEDLVRTDATTRFLVGTSAFIFVVDPATALRSSGLHVLPEPVAGEPWPGDRTFGAVLDRLPRADRLIDVPAAVVVGKGDLIRYVPPVDRWLNREVRPPLDPELVAEESRDAYAFLYSYGARPWLKPFMECRRCTLHFASASGGQARDRRFPSGARSHRAIQPLLSIFAMWGLLGADLATSVGV